MSRKCVGECVGVAEHRGRGTTSTKAPQMAALALSLTFPPRPLTMLYISTTLCVCDCSTCQCPSEKTYYSFTLREATVGVHQSVLGDPEAPGTARSSTHTHIYTGHYTHTHTCAHLMRKQRAWRGRKRTQWLVPFFVPVSTNFTEC